MTGSAGSWKLVSILVKDSHLAVMAFQFGDGISNTFWFTNGTLLIYLSLAKVPLKSWYKFILPLQGMFLVMQLVFLYIAVAIGYGPF